MLKVKVLVPSLVYHKTYQSWSGKGYMIDRERERAAWEVGQPTWWQYCANKYMLHPRQATTQLQMYEKRNMCFTPTR